MRKIAFLIFALLLVSTVPAFAQDKAPAKDTPPAPSTITPSKTWLDSLGALNDMDQERQELQGELTALQNLEQKKQQQLVAEIPAGYSYDPAKQMFVKTPEVKVPEPPKPADKK